MKKLYTTLLGIGLFLLFFTESEFALTNLSGLALSWAASYKLNLFNYEQ